MSERSDTGRRRTPPLPPSPLQVYRAAESVRFLRWRESWCKTPQSGAMARLHRRHPARLRARP
jgi:hypothetical protein